MHIVGYVLVAAVSSCLIAFSILRKKKECMVNYVFRIVVGVLAIYLTNMILPMLSIKVAVGINAYSILTLGLLGAPGYVMLYCISTYFTLK